MLKICVLELGILITFRAKAYMPELSSGIVALLLEYKIIKSDACKHGRFYNFIFSSLFAQKTGCHLCDSLLIISQNAAPHAFDS